MAAIWNLENIRAGMERFIVENDRMPTARDFDESSYLPTARQIQRLHGGLVGLRKILGYKDLDYTKGELRKRIAIQGNKIGLNAEEYFEPLLVRQFGEPYVHTQKRYYKNSKHRYDFLVYASKRTFAIDIFTTSRAAYIEKNIRHKVQRYKLAPSDLQIYFVLVGASYDSSDVSAAGAAVSELQKYPNMSVLHESDFLELITTFIPLDPPLGFKSIG